MDMDQAWSVLTEVLGLETDGSDELARTKTQLEQEKETHAQALADKDEAHAQELADKDAATAKMLEEKNKELEELRRKLKAAGVAEGVPPEEPEPEPV